MKVFYAIIGLIFFMLGVIGVIIPVLPTTPFLLLAAFFFAKSSTRVNQWFKSTKIYKNHLKVFINDRAMTLKQKFMILIPASCMLILCIFMIPNQIGKIFILFLIGFKYLYFFTSIRTIPIIDKSLVK